jgi:hypothetical protein
MIILNTKFSVNFLFSFLIDLNLSFYKSWCKAAIDSHKNLNLMKNFVLCFAFLFSFAPLVAQNTFALYVDTPNISSNKTFVAVVETPNAYVVASEDKSDTQHQRHLFEISKQGGILRKIPFAPIDPYFQFMNLQVLVNTLSV